MEYNDEDNAKTYSIATQGWVLYIAFDTNESLKYETFSSFGRLKALLFYAQLKLLGLAWTAAGSVAYFLVASASASLLSLSDSSFEL